MCQNSETTALQWKLYRHTNFNLKLASPYHIHMYEDVRRETFLCIRTTTMQLKIPDSIIKEHKNRIVLKPSLSLY